MIVMETQEWAPLAKCIGMGDALFAEGSEQRQMRRFCSDCPVRTECLVEALDNRIEWGIWGGMTERERRAMLKQRPHVRSWKEVLTQR